MQSQTSTRKLSSKLGKLGTETAYSVSLESQQLAAKGVKIYPFHIGDINMVTPQVVIDAAKKALEAGKTGYCPAQGVAALRDALAQRIGQERGVQYTSEEVSIQPGGKPVIGKFLLTVMEEGDEVLYPNPGYPIYESMIKFHGGVAKPYTFKETSEGFVMDMDFLRKQITPRTRVLVYNNYQNPVGTASSEKEMQEIADLCIKHNLWVLSDEPYFEIVYGIPSRSIVSLPGMKERTVILYTFSKNYAMTGWRLGAAIGPVEVIQSITKLNTNDEACTTHFVQWAGIQALSPEAKKFTHDMVEEMQRRRDVLVSELNKIPGIRAHTPPSTFYVFVNVTQLMRQNGFDDVEKFRQWILHNTGVSFCTREHFGTPLPFEQEKYVRFAFSGINVDMIKEAMVKLSQFVASQNRSLMTSKL